MVNLIYEDNHLVAANKANGILVQKDNTGDEALEDQIRNYLKAKYNKPGEAFCHATHRIDRPVSGIVLFAKTSKALARINEGFKEKTIRKTYLALAQGQLQEGKNKLTHWLIKDSRNNKTRVFNQQQKNTQESTLYLESIKTIGGFTLLKIELETGRHHQIRAQLAHIGYPIVGDSKYGSSISTGPAIYLHSHTLTFEHPITKEPLSLEASLPDLKYWKQFL